MPDLQSVSFSTEGWRTAQDDGMMRAWENAEKDTLSLHLFLKVPDLAGPLSRIDRIREGYRTGIVQAGGALVEVEIDELETVPALRTIFKLPQQLHGMSYIGAWTIPRKSFSFVVKVCCAEHGTTGIRDAVVAAKIQLPHGEDDPFQGWFQSLFMPSKFILLNIHRPSSVMHSA